MYNDGEALNKIGALHSGFAGNAMFKGLYPQDPIVVEQDELVSKMAHFAVCLMGERLASLAQYMFQFPYAFILLLHDEHRDSILLEAKCLSKSWASAKLCKIAAVKKLCKRSCMKWQLVLDVFATLEAVDFSHVPDPLAKMIRHVFSHFGTSKIIEDLFQRVRPVENDSGQGVLSSPELYMMGTSNRLATHVYKYNEVDAGGGEAAPVEKNSLPECVFEPLYTQASSEKFKQLPGSTSSLFCVFQPCFLQSSSWRAAGDQTAWRCRRL